MRAVVVFPTPRTPVRIQACGIRPVSNAFEIVRTIASWPIRSVNVAGRYLRASTRYEAPAAPRSSPGLVASFILTKYPVSFRKPRSGCPESITPKSHDTEGPAFMDSGLAISSRPGMTVFGSGRLTSDPSRSSLGLLPSGPDPVGEWLVHRQ